MRWEVRKLRGQHVAKWAARIDARGISRASWGILERLAGILAREGRTMSDPRQVLSYSSSGRRRVPVWVWAVAVLVLLALGGGWVVWSEVQADRARARALERVKQLQVEFEASRGR